MNKKRTKIKNFWKILFFGLLGLVCGIVLLFAFRIISHREPDLVIGETRAELNDEPVFQVSLTKSQTNDLINFFLDDFQKDSELKYYFRLENKALLTGTYNLLGYDIDFYVYFEPYVLENGDLQLIAKSLSIGTLSLPTSELLKYVEKNLPIPEWVEVDPENEKILLHLNEYSLNNGMSVKVEELNLVDDKILINVYLPKDN